MAVSEDEEFEFRRRAEAEKAPPKPSLMARFVKFADDAGQGAQDFVGKYGRQLSTGAGAIVGGALAAPEAAVAAVPTAGVGGVAVEGAGIGLGGAIGGNIYDRFAGRNQKLAQQLGAAGTDFATNAAAAPAGRLVGAAADAAAPYVTPAVQRLAGALSKPVAAAGQAVSAVPQRVASLLDAGATPAAQQVTTPVRQRLADLLAQQQDVTAQAEAAKAADVPLRATMEQAATSQADKGIGVGDVPEAQALVADLKSRLKPTGSVVTVPTTAQAAAYQKIIDALTPTAEGQKPSLEMIQNLRREIESPAYAGSDPSSFAAISKLDKRDLGKQLSGIEDAYTGGASAPVRENWRNYSVLQEQADAMAKTKDMFTTQAAQLDELPPIKAAQRAQTIATGLAKNGLISDADYREIAQLANAATDARGKALFRKRIALAIGGGAVGYEAARLGGHAMGVLP